MIQRKIALINLALPIEGHGIKRAQEEFNYRPASA
jgi:hypothetical protein